MSPQVPATLGGAGWRPRRASHVDDVRSGSVWHPCGLESEFGRVMEVTLCLPDESFVPSGNPNDALFLEWPDQMLLCRQARALGAFYAAQGITVHWVDAIPACPNFLFQRDLYFLTPDGAVIARPASDQRAGEARAMARFLANLGVPIIGMPTGDAMFEGADALWLNPGQVLVGIGERTNRLGALYLSRLLEERNVQVLSIDLPHGVQHLLGLVNFIDRDLGAVRDELATPALVAALERSGVQIVRCECGKTIANCFGMNFVTLKPRHVVIPAGHPNVAHALAAFGVRIDEIDISEYLKAAGGIGCLTGILRREAA